MVVGAARPSDWDEHLKSIKLYGNSEAKAHVKNAVARLQQMEIAATDRLFGNDWEIHEKGTAGATAP